ncbi:glycosyl hydrolase catalytic core-domain-containing protein [Lasiosphaeria miniovina]|uniref:Glycosyl hydrolase catalytic core-domain-containing protein n=1 Tax=Lasiosphaeria miniovina TaxID=1954250 RepID=A0AA40E3F2_9PEZI|nr:glycosyl hydrolase catalytic core-domain-containing protein [Lasiosphaeria miniovina]KAK0723592.1 glycosyl hydrolase catalytic core-domain-containing protein [Lasiosphaeria miniovina]
MLSSPAAIGAALLTVLHLLVGSAVAGPLASPKRGLVYVPNNSTRQDDYIWTQQPSDLTWYYNYEASPSPVYSKISQSSFEFVPMLWGAPDNLSDTTFLKTVRSLVKDKGINISHVMAFNEPDGSMGAHGGSNIDPDKAAQVWVKNIIPLQEMNLRVGLPACTGAPSGLQWLKAFLDSCSKLVSTDGKTTNCTFDFVPIHWYGNFDGLASHLGEYSAEFPNKTMWVTEFNFDNQDLETTQAFYNMSTEYMDRLDSVGRYSLFGAFRSDVSNVGPNGAMLTAEGNLTDIGAWYLGRPATGVSPKPTSLALQIVAPQATVALGAIFATVSLLNF